MPVYEYLCASCDNRFEAIRSMSQADAPIACPRCAAPNARKVISVFAAISRDGGGSRMVAGGSSSSCGSCAGGHCASCGSH
ncbi:MAG: Zinc ribbon domain protein [Chloroflexi bacterium ADurb.Bin325]|nr:MAG: Zinc ribbon domain protein [Chloroflexi bacterium ADurb.Bin325]